MKKNFISHRSTESTLVDELVQYLENIGIDKDDIMYTSADSSGIQYDIGQEVKLALKEAKLFIVILSTNYYESIYCCNELGYIWSHDVKSIIFGLPGINSDKDYQGFINKNWIIRRLNNTRHIDFLYQELQPYSKKDITSLVRLNEYKESYLNRINAKLEEYALNKKPKEREQYSPEKLMDLDSLIQSNYYTDKELLLFSYLIDTNNYIWGLSENIKNCIIKWEKENRIKPFLSQNLEAFFIMLVRKGYLNCKIIERQELAVKSYIDQDDKMFNMMRAVFQADENGNTKHNYFSMDERLFREIINIDDASKSVLKKVVKKHRCKWYQKYSAES